MSIKIEAINHFPYFSIKQREKIQEESNVQEKAKEPVLIPSADSATYLKSLDKIAKTFGEKKAVQAHGNIAFDAFPRWISPTASLCGLLFFSAILSYQVYNLSPDKESNAVVQVTLLLYSSVALGFFMVQRVERVAYSLYRKSTMLHQSDALNGFLEKDIKQIITSSQANKKNALIIKTDDLFFLNNAQHRAYFESMGLASLRYTLLYLKRMGYAIHYIIADPKINSPRLLDTVKDRSLDFVLIHGHGLPSGISLNKKFWFDGVSDRSRALMEELAKKVRGCPSFILRGCSAGWGDNNIAKTLSLFFGNARVHASTKLIDACKLVRLTKKGATLFPHFSRLSNHVPTRTYRNGIEIMQDKSPIQEKNVDSSIVRFIKEKFFAFEGWLMTSNNIIMVE